MSVDEPQGSPFSFPPPNMSSDSASDTASTMPSDGGSTASSTASSTAQVELEASPPADPPRSRKGRMVAAVVALAVLGGGGFVVARNISSSSGGFDTPEAAVAALFKAADQEDVLGLVDVMRPGERALLRDVLLPLQTQMKRLDVLSGATDLHKVAGVQVTVDGLAMSAEKISERVAVVTLTAGTMTGNATIAELPLGKVLRDKVDPSSFANSQTAHLKGTKLATVKEDGRWYVSLGYTIAEQARRSAGGAIPDFADPVPAPGAANPADAVKGFSSAVAELDLSKAIGFLSPGEFGALQDYAPLFLADAQKVVDTAKKEQSLELAITYGTPKVEAHDNVAYVSFDTVKIDASFAQGHVTATLDAKGCVKVTGTGPANDGVGDQAFDKSFCPGDVGADKGVPDDVKPILGRLSKISIRGVTVRENGHWYVSPIRTLFDLSDQLLSAMQSFDDFSTIGSWLTGVAASTISGRDIAGVTGISVPGDTIPFDSIPVDSGPPLDSIPIDQSVLNPALQDFAAIYEGFVGGDTPAHALTVMQNNGLLDPSATFLDDTGAALPPGTFDGVFAVRIDDATGSFCMTLPEAGTPPAQLACP